MMQNCIIHSQILDQYNFYFIILNKNKEWDRTVEMGQHLMNISSTVQASIFWNKCPNHIPLNHMWGLIFIPYLSDNCQALEKNFPMDQARGYGMEYFKNNNDKKLIMIKAKYSFNIWRTIKSLTLYIYIHIHTCKYKYHIGCFLNKSMVLRYILVF